MFRLGASTSATETVGRSLAARVDAASYAAMAYWFYRWDWGEAIAMDGLMAVGEGAAGGAARHFAIREANEWVGESAATDVDPMGPASVVMDLLEQGRWDRSTLGVDAMRKLVAITIDNGSPLRGLSVHRGDTALFVDALYGLPSALIRFGRYQEADDVIDQVSALAVQHCDALQREDGLFSHFSESAQRGSAAWGRGTGWAVLGLSDLLTVLPEASPHFAELRDRLVKAVEGLSSHQCVGGEFRNIVDQAESYPEASTTAMVAAGVAQSVALGHVDDGHRDLADRAWAAVAHRIDTNGHLVGVSYRPGVNADIRRYEHTPAVGSYPWGQGAFLRAAAVHGATGI